MAERVSEPPGTWTFEDLLLFSGQGGRQEIVDGALVMSPSPGRRHETVSTLLRHALHHAVAPGRVALGPISVDMNPTYREPDLVVVDRVGDDTAKLQVADVHLVVEVVSPGSRTTDRITKPAQYAAAGIPAYWKVETDGEVSITAYALREGDTVYAELGTWGEGETLRVSEPFDVELDIDDLVP